MADSTDGLRRKIGSAADLQSVVRAMKAQAAAAIGQYERSVAALDDYARNVELGLGVCLRLDAPVPAPNRPRGRMIRAIVFGSDQGLVGRFNEVVVEHARAALDRIPGRVQVWAAGERVRSGLADAGLPLLGVFPVPASVQGIAALVGQILVKVVEEARGADDPSDIELHLFHNRASAGDAFAPVGLRLLPLDDAWRQALATRSWPTGVLPEVLGNVASTRRALVREYLFVSIFRAYAESLASENASRLAAMDRADRNIDKMLVTLHDRFHRLRQGRIDEELSDVISGFKALGDSACDPAPHPH